MPGHNNVYGLLKCDARIAELAEIVRIHMSLADSEIEIKKSQFDGAETIIICSKNADFTAYRGATDGELLFNGVVAGNDQEVWGFVKELHRTLAAADFRPRFEIYGEDNTFLAYFEARP
jgi:hypothetical protein